MRLVIAGHELDPRRRELRRADGGAVHVEPQVFDLLVHLVRNRDRVVGKDELFDTIWQGRVVSEAALSSRINAARKAIGDDGDRQELIRTVHRRGFRFVGEARELPEAEGRPPAAGPRPSGAPGDARPAAAARRDPAPAHQEIRFCAAADGTRIAYATAGRGPPLLKAANWLNHLEYDWESPFWGHLLHQLARGRTLVRYDARGTGLSDAEVGELSLEAWVRDLEAVADAAGLERFPLLGISQGCAISVAYAVRHPGRVSHLVLSGGFALGAFRRGAAEAERRRAMASLIRTGWGQDNPAFRQLFAALFMPAGTKAQHDAFGALQRVTASPEMAARYFDAVGHFDVTGLLARVRAPTLVLHALGDAMNPVECGRQLAAGIPGARFVALPGVNHLPLEGEAGLERFFAEIESFLGA
jgi:pimeloyl-ACP methyl ester carboxylesterase/DNA-binding winged helix-turn-helix (wHTH) protein